jgi:hypothetical protein
MNPSQTQAEPPTFHGVRVDNPTILTYIRNGIKQGWNNEQICKVVGCPQEIVDKERAKLKKLAESVR